MSDIQHYADNAPATTNTAGGDLVGTTHDRGVRRAGELSSAYSPRELDALRALGGLDEASDGDLDMLAAVAERTGLDPFVREVYLIGRKTKTGGYRGEPERWETKWTVQAGIDGFRKVTHRYAQSRGEGVEIGKAIFYDADGNPRPFWLKAWGYPAAAEITVRVGDSVATGIATWDEYAQTRKDGNPTAMWDNMRSTMLAKCAEAQAHRKVCSLTAGMYEPAEIREPVAVTATRTDTPARGAGTTGAIAAAKQRMVAAANPAPEPAPVDDPVAGEADLIDALLQGLTTRADEAENVDALQAVFDEAAGQFADGSNELQTVIKALNKKLETEGWEL